MKKTFAGVLTLLLILCLSGCQTIGNKAASQSYIYGAVAILSFLLLIACWRFVQKNRVWFIVLFSSVLVVNIGYTLLSVSVNLEMALWANRVAYLGSVFLPLSMLMIILDVTNTHHPKWLRVALGVLSIIIFLIAASPGILPIYYKEVSFAVVNGVSTLVKVYGPLHPLYLFYLIGYFISMVAVIIRAQVKKKIDTTAHAVILVIAVFVNIGVWFIEQITSIDFEMLSVSYIISELFLLSINMVVNDNQRLRHIVKTVESAKNVSPTDPSQTAMMIERPVDESNLDSAKIEIFINGLERLTHTERAIYNAYISRVTTKEIMANLNITENTLKYHNKNLYGKLGVSSRKELLEIYKQLKAILHNCTEN